MKPKQRVVCVLFKNVTSIQEFAEACFRFTPQISVRSNEAVFLEIGGSLNLFREETILLRLSVLAQRFGLMPQFGVADDAPTALAMARYSCSNAENLPLQSLHDYASPFVTDEVVHKKTARLIEVLHVLGLKSLSDFMALPSRTLASRFGEEGLELGRRVYKSLHGELELLWPRFHPAETVSERTDLFDSGATVSCMDLEPFLFLVRGIADRVMARLRGRGLRIATLELEADLEASRRLDSRKCSTISWTIRLPVPQGSVSGLIPILRDRLAHDFSRSPLESPVIGICLRVLETAQGYGAQKNLFHSQEEESEAWDSLVGRLAQKLGQERAFMAKAVDRYVPEHAWQPAIGMRACEYVDNSVDESERPTRILRKPRFLEKIGDMLSHQEKFWRTVEWQGPERISCEWWRDPSYEGFNRDYYRVFTDSGEQLWIYSVPGRSGFYLHGYFD